MRGWQPPFYLAFSAHLQLIDGGAIASTFGLETVSNAMNPGREAHENAGLAASPQPTESGQLVAEQWRLTTSGIQVTLVWAYDTVAILDDYHDSEDATLPAGHLVAFSQIADESPAHVLCDIEDHGRAERECLAAGRVMRHRPFCFATRLQAVMLAEDFLKFTVPAPRPSWLRRVIRTIHCNRHTVSRGAEPIADGNRP